MRKIFSLLVFAAFLGGGLWVVALGVKDAWKAWESGHWPTTPGTVISSSVQVSQGRRGASYSPKISYTYSVNGQNYTGTSITPGRLWSSSTAYEMVRSFPRGSQPPIYYSLTVPSEATLIPGLHLYNFAYVILGLIPITFGSVIGGFTIMAWLSGTPPNSDGTYSLNNSPGGTLFFLAGFTAFIVEVGLLFWVGHR